MRFWKRKRGSVEPRHLTEKNTSGLNTGDLDQNLSTSLNLNVDMVKIAMGNASDLTVRVFTLSSITAVRAAVISIKGMTERELINEQVLGVLMGDAQFGSLKGSLRLFEYIKESGLPCLQVIEKEALWEVVHSVITGNTVLLLDGLDKALEISSQGWKDRNVSEPVTENVVRGPRDGFTETLHVNTALLRRRIKSPDLRIEEIIIGSRTKTCVLIVYLDQVASAEVVDEVRKRLERIKIDGVLESGQIEHSERPDKVAAGILEGRVAIMTFGGSWGAMPLRMLALFQIY